MRFTRAASLAVIGLLAAAVVSAPPAHAFLDTPPSHGPVVFQPSSRTDARGLPPPVTVLRESLDRDPAQPDVLVALGQEFERIGDLMRAQAAYREALQAQPDHAAAFYHFWKARLRAQARVLPFRTGPAPSPAREHAEQVTGPGPSWLDAGAGAISAGALRAFLNANPGRVEERIQLGLALLGTGQVDAALDQYRNALAIDPEHTGARVHLAHALILARQWQAARRHLEEVLRLSPRLARAHSLLGVVLYTLNDLQGAMEAYRRALETDPGSTQAHFQLGVLLTLAGREQESVVHLAEAAHRGVPEAQYLVGAAYLDGRGVGADPARGLVWWIRAAEQGLPEAREELARLRLAAARNRPAHALRAAFDRYRASLWEAYPELSPGRPGELVGLRLLQVGRAEEAVPVLVREALALSAPAHRILETLYEVGVHGALAPYDRRILEFFQSAAGDGFPRSLLVLGRIYHDGVGVTADHHRASRLFARYRASRGADPVEGAPAVMSGGPAGRLPLGAASGQ